MQDRPKNYHSRYNISAARRRRGHSPIPEQLVHAVLDKISADGLANVTTKSISDDAQVSTGIIHHYFETKDRLVYVSYVHLIVEHRAAIVNARRQYPQDPAARLKAMVAVNFSNPGTASELARVWPQFWANAMYDSAVKRLLKAYNIRFYHNILYDFKYLLPAGWARQHARNLLSLIHGYWVESMAVESMDAAACVQRIHRYIEQALDPENSHHCGLDE